MLMQSEREQIVEYGIKMFQSGLTNGTTGNMSMYNKDLGYMAISPSGIPYPDTKPEDIVIVDLDGNIIDGERKPSSEIHLHTEVYKRKPDMVAAVHTHSDYSTVMGCLRWDLPAAHYMINGAGANTIKCAEYATFGTEELAIKTMDGMGNAKATYMANHGLLVCHITMEKALGLAEKVEWFSKIYITSKSVGDPVILTNEEMVEVFEMAKSYGQPKK
jgi:L-fuculose-phosphate aldolase